MPNSAACPVRADDKSGDRHLVFAGPHVAQRELDVVPVVRHGYEVATPGFDRRAFLRRTALTGVAAGSVSTILAACGSSAGGTTRRRGPNR